MPSCVAVGCSNRSENGYCMKVFPKDPERRAVWAANVKREFWEPTNSSYLCECHFSPDQWEKQREDGKKKLKFSAVPTVFSDQLLAAPRRKSSTKRKGTPNPMACVIADYTNPTKKRLVESGIGLNIVVDRDEAGSGLPSAPPSEYADLKERIKILEHELELRDNIIASLRKKIRANNAEKSRNRKKEEKVSQVFTETPH